jgi:DNA-binding Lrp family transcriptional regulator
MTEISASEWKMLGIVQESHVTNVELAERLGMAASPCLRRMKALKDRGFIERTVSRSRAGLSMRSSYVRSRASRRSLAAM